MIGTDIQKAIQLLNAGELVAIPTETVYGLAGNAMSAEAVAHIFEVKNRPSFDPLIIHTSDMDRLDGLVSEIPEQVHKLEEKFLPGPLTILLPKTDRIPDIVTAGSEKVAVRIPQHPMALSLLQLVDYPLAAPSANPFGYISPTSAEHVENQLGEDIPYILDGGPCTVGVESTIIGFEKGKPVIYRKGGLAVEEIEKVLGPVEVKKHSSSSPQAPGMLQSHYAPGAPLHIGRLVDLISSNRGKKIGVISFQDSFKAVPDNQQICLSEEGNLEEAARNLFAGMRKLDILDLDIILAELVPEQGLGRAINDRLRRAAFK